MDQLIGMAEAIRRMAQLARDRAREQPGLEYYANTLNEIDRQAKMVAQQLSKREPDMVAQQPPRDNLPILPRERDAEMVTQQMRGIADGVIPWDMNYVYGVTPFRWSTPQPDRNRR